MVRVAKKSDPQKLKELKRKIHDEHYLAMAIERIALDLTRNIVDKERR